MFFLCGITAQVVVLSISFFFLHNVHQKNGNEIEEEMFSTLDQEMQATSSGKLRLPFAHHVVGQGRVLPSTGYIEVTPGVAGEITEINVRAGDYVKEGDLLFRIDDADLKFALKEKIADYDASIAALNLIKEGPSHLTLQAKEKEIEQVNIQLAKSEKLCSIFQSLLEKQAVTENETQEKQAEHAILAKGLEKILVEYEGLSEPVSNSQIEIRKAHVKKNEANVAASERKYRKCQSNAPISGRILAVNVHKGERVNESDRNTIIMGSDSPLHLKVHIDEKDAWRISPNKNLRAIAIHKSNPKLHFILSYVSLTPLLNKSENESQKLELTFSFEKGMAPIYLEEMLDVYIESASPSDTACLDYQFSQLR